MSTPINPATLVHSIHSWRVPLLTLILIGLYACGYQLRTVTVTPFVDHGKIILQVDDPTLYQTVSNTFSQAGMTLHQANLHAHTETDIVTREQSDSHAKSASTKQNADILLQLSNTKFTQEVRLYDADNLPRQWRLHLSTQFTQHSLNGHDRLTLPHSTGIRQLNNWIDLNNSSSSAVNHQAIASTKQQLFQRMAEQILYEFRQQ